MATKRYYLNKVNHAAEEMRPDSFGLIGGADAAVAFLHGFEITMDGCVDQPIKSGVPVVLKGVAFGGDRGIARVKVSFDDARTWQEARLDYSSSRLEWVLWNYNWRPAQPGEYKLAVRATDGAGQVQTSEERGAAPEGSTGYHKVTARVEA